jgi:transposase InsO family protein
MTRERQDSGLSIGRRRTARLMRENGSTPGSGGGSGGPPCSHPAWPVAPNRLDQDFSAEGPDQKGGSDLPFLWPREGWLDLAVLIDRFARRVVGWAGADRLHRALALAVLRRTLTMRRRASGLIHRSNRGGQYCSLDYQAELRKHGILISVSGKGNCSDNSMVETFFKTLKSELIWRTMFETRQQAEQAIGRTIDGFFNPVRRHSAPDYTSAIQFEKMVTNWSDPLH